MNFKYKDTTEAQVGDLVVWTDPGSNTRIANKPYQVISTVGSIVKIKDEQGYLEGYGSASRKTLETKPADQAAVGDYMYRITSGTLAFSHHSVIKITKKGTKELFYTPTRSVFHDEVIVIAQAEPEVKYPLFKEDIKLGFIFKYTGTNEGIYLTNNGIPNRKPGEYVSTISSEDNASWKPCDFTTEPEIFDIDWWQQRFEAGLPVYAIGPDDYVSLCRALSPKECGDITIFSMTDPSLIQKVPMSKEDIELFKQQVPLSTLHLGLCQEISLDATTEGSLQTTIPLCTVSTCEMSVTDVKYFTYKKEQKPIQKEKPMTFQDFINSLFTEEIKTDYEKKPNFLVTIYNSEGTEIAVTTATSIKSVEDTLKSSPKLWGSKAVMYSIDSEVQVSVPVVTTKFKNPEEEK